MGRDVKVKIQYKESNLLWFLPPAFARPFSGLPLAGGVFGEHRGNRDPSLAYTKILTKLVIRNSTE
jgi:hypothetical protein